MMIAEWDIWKFQGEDMKLFRKGQPIPHGWNDSPGEHKRDPADHAAEPVKRGPGRPRKVQP